MLIHSFIENKFNFFNFKMTNSDFSKNLKDQLTFQKELLSNLKNPALNPEYKNQKISVSKKLNLEQIKNLKNKIQDHKFENKEDKKKFLNFIELYEKLEGLTKKTWTGMGVNFIVNSNILSNAATNFGSWWHEINDPKTKRIINSTIDLQNYLKAYFDQILFDFHQNFNEESLNIIKNFLNTKIFSFKDQDNQEKNSINLWSLMPKINEESTGQPIQLDEILKNIFEFGETPALSKIMDDFGKKLDKLDTTENPNLIKIFLDNAFDLLKDTASFLDGKEKIKNLLKISSFDLDKDENQSFKEIFDSFFKIFKSEQEGEEQYLIISSVNDLNDFIQKLLDFKIKDKDLIADKDTKQIASISNEILKIIFQSNLPDGTNKEIKINFKDKNLNILNDVIKASPNVLKENLDQSNIENNLAENKELIKIFLNIAKHLRGKDVGGENKRREEIQKKIINLIKNFNKDDAIALAKEISNDNDLKNDLIDLLAFANKKIREGIFFQVEKKDKPKDKPKDDQKKNEIDKKPEENSSLITNDEQTVNLVLNGLFHGNNKEKKNLLLSLKGTLELTLAGKPKLKEKLFAFIETLGADSQNDEIIINPKNLQKNTKELFQFLKDQESTPEKQKRIYDLSIKSLELLSVFGENKLHIREKERNSLFRQIFNLLQTDLVKKSIENILKPDPDLTTKDMDEKNKIIINLKTENQNIDDEKNKLIKENESQKNTINRLNKGNEENKKFHEGLNKANINFYKQKIQKKESRQYLYFSITFATAGMACLMTSATLKENGLIGKKGFQIMFGIFASCLVISAFCLIKSIKIGKQEIPSENLNLRSANPVDPKNPSAPEK